MKLARHRKNTALHLLSITDGKCIYIAVQQAQNPEKVEPIIQSLTFK